MFNDKEQILDEVRSEKSKIQKQMLQDLMLYIYQNLILVLACIEMTRMNHFK